MLGRIKTGFFYIFVCFFSLVGIMVSGLELYSWQAGTRWQPHDINALLMYDSPTMQMARTVWADIKYLIQYGAYLLAALALFIAVAQIKTVAKLISDFIVAKGPIYELGSVITRVESSVAGLTNEVDRLSQLEPTIQATAEKLKEVLQRLGDLQRLTVSERTDSDGAAATSPLADSDVRNWERLRELWNANGRRLDDVIERIPDKRRRNRFQRMPRTSYPAIINGLADDNLISEAARQASLQLHATFMSYKPRNRKIPDPAVAALVVLDELLERELAPTNDDGDETPPHEPRPAIVDTAI